MALVSGARVRYAHLTMHDNDAATRVTAEALCGRFEASLDSGAEGVVVSDGDGTLWRGDVGDAFFDMLVDGGRLRAEARDALEHEAAEAGLPTSGDATALAARLRDGFRAGLVDEGRYFALQTWSAAGYRTEELAALCRSVLDGCGWDRSVRPAMRRVMAWCEARGIAFYLVSASPAAIVREAGWRLGLQPERVVAMEPATCEGVVLPGLARTPTYGVGKVARLVEVLGETPLLAAFGDNTWDAAMLERAAFPVTVAPQPGLVAKLAGYAGVFDLEDA